MKAIRCTGCWQPISFMTKRCPRCGNTDPHNLRKSITELVLGATAIVGGIGIVFFVFLSQIGYSGSTPVIDPASAVIASQSR
jgi:hypothetical protein